jgi:predicted nucleic acid-binding protein
MSAAVFIDTGAWYALQVPNDRWHHPAVATLRALAAQRLPLVTSNHVLGESYTLLMKTHGQAAAWRFRERLLASPLLEITHVDEALESEAWQLLRRYADQAFSFVDAVSFALMKRRRLQRAFAFDVHFATAGFVRIPVDKKEP